MSTTSNYSTRVVNSALWSAYGDALGFITELRDNQRAIYARVGSNRVDRTLPWRRRVGGKFGVEAALPSGCYSDDTQLRLATGRAIRPDASFNVEAFAKMELPVWISYALGAGRGTKAAATMLAHEGVSWFSNFYETALSEYFQSGGNGAAMRIQPHIWAAKGGATFQELVNPVVRNAVTTHGHARAIVGAVFHAMCLEYARGSGTIPNVDSWKAIIDGLGNLGKVVEEDPDLKTFWLPVWEQRSGTTFRGACVAVQTELLRDVQSLVRLAPTRSKDDTYRLAVQTLGGFDERERGSSTKTVLLAAFLSDLFRDDGPARAVICAANCLSSDTDTIATMAGAIMGLTGGEGPPSELMDKFYIAGQAERLARISAGQPTEQTHYPNLLNWKPPKTQQESVVLSEKGLEVLVLGRVAVEQQKFEIKPSDPILWQWLQLESGQTILAKRRRKPPQMNSCQRTFVPDTSVAQIAAARINQAQLPLPAPPATERGISKAPNIDDLTKQAIQAHFDPKIVGEHLLLLSSSPDGVERAVAYAAIIAKARLARVKHNT